ncbi:neuropeptide CCHamide-2 [Drosophila virilis]|uniref:Uncharacterized protein, isoform A n=1 Tax=Drosophila virilis TaxID=7244 RepID=B4M6B3_DROVI|nr:neuropeptide CCHamide-2 isoform X1 [Drosophila virilis]XP_015026046.1 neuropeptide CCHamide-2 isoform X1 [Drosophila virilis]EDW59189.1 uncharacterized protein Dvir_GJ10742, isoform A [Drosophila virilis]KRF78744.1 uncharacterized protein Dvir_GJ10742, isoform C [Drosophila virilis]
MKSTISLLLVVICTVVLAAQQSQAKKGCQAYGHVCYGGHGKRSLSASGTGSGSAASANVVGLEQEFVRPNGLLPMLAANEQAPAMPEPEFDDYPSRQVLYKIMKSWFNRPHRPVPRLGELDYPLSSSGESFNREVALNTLN